MGSRYRYRQRQRLSLPGRALYRPPGIPVLVGSDTFGRVHSGIPTQRPGPRGLSAASEAKDAIATSGASRESNPELEAAHVKEDG